MGERNIGRKCDDTCLHSSSFRPFSFLPRRNRGLYGSLPNFFTRGMNPRGSRANLPCLPTYTRQTGMSAPPRKYSPLSTLLFRLSSLDSPLSTLPSPLSTLNPQPSTSLQRQLLNCYCNNTSFVNITCWGGRFALLPQRFFCAPVGRTSVRPGGRIPRRAKAHLTPSLAGWLTVRPILGSIGDKRLATQREGILYIFPRRKISWQSSIPPRFLASFITES